MIIKSYYKLVTKLEAISVEGNAKLSKRKAYLVPIIIMFVMGVILFLPAGSFRFWQAWIWWLSFSVLTIFMTAYFLKKSPELLSRRMKVKEKKELRRPPAFLNLNYLSYIVPGIDYRLFRIHFYYLCF